MLKEWRASVSQQLSAARVAHVTDPRAFQPPGILVGSPAFAIDAPTLFGNATCVISIGVPPPGDGDALDQLLTMTDQVTAALSDIVTSITPGQVPYGEQSIPGYRVTVQFPVSL